MNRNLLLALLLLLEEDDDDDLLLLTLLSSSDDDDDSSSSDDDLEVGEDDYDTVDVRNKKRRITNGIHRGVSLNAKHDSAKKLTALQLPHRTRNNKQNDRKSLLRNIPKSSTNMCLPLVPIKEEIICESNGFVNIGNSNVIIKIEPGHSYEDIRYIEPDRFEMKDEPSSPDFAPFLGDDVDVKSETDPFFEDAIENIEIDDVFMKEEKPDLALGNYLKSEPCNSLGEFLSFKKKFSCSICNEGLATRVSLKRHFNLMHRDTSHLLCAECHVRFMKKTDLQSHIELQH